MKLEERTRTHNWYEYTCAAHARAVATAVVMETEVKRSVRYITIKLSLILMGGVSRLWRTGLWDSALASGTVHWELLSHEITCIYPALRSSLLEIKRLFKLLLRSLPDFESAS